MRYTGWILAAITMAAVAGCGKSNDKASMTYKPLDMGPRTRPTVTKPATTPKTVARPAASAWEVRNTKPWRYIVIHHSASSSGSAASFHKAHLARGWHRRTQASWPRD